MTELVVVDGAELADAAAARLAALMRAAIARDGSASVALAGGETPRPAYQRLASMRDLPWPLVHVYFGDERAVPPDAPDSNYRMVFDSLLRWVPVRAASIHRLEAERPDRDAAAAQYAVLLPPRLDLILLGIGADGHTASLFPGSPATTERERLVVAVPRPTPPDRLTVTPPVISGARTRVVIAMGAAKAEAVARALEGTESVRDCPARLARDGLWLLDRAAAAMLRRPDS